MPTYEYLCQNCGYKFEKFQSIVQDPVSECPVCSSNAVTRLVTGGAGVIFKGSGFYETDYKKKKAKQKTTKKSNTKKEKK
ncbi:zinc ribbon domain-containing protein [candidate division KSB1 bacterium]|nr:zinc ribbon domain-containing protein [candidate division KSB1 bacterium]